MLLAHAQRMDKLPSISKLVLPTAMDVCSPESVRIKDDDEEDCARILVGLHSPSALAKGKDIKKPLPCTLS